MRNNKPVVYSLVGILVIIGVVYCLVANSEYEDSKEMAAMGIAGEASEKQFETSFFISAGAVNFILAGRDTSSVALSWFFWLIDQHPEIEEKILAEICGITEKREINEDNKGPLVFRPEEVKKMEYLQAAISEALRLYPSVPVDHKEVNYSFFF